MDQPGRGASPNGKYTAYAVLGDDAHHLDEGSGPGRSELREFSTSLLEPVARVVAHVEVSPGVGDELRSRDIEHAHHCPVHPLGEQALEGRLRGRADQEFPSVGGDAGGDVLLRDRQADAQRGGNEEPSGLQLDSADAEPAGELEIVLDLLSPTGSLDLRTKRHSCDVNGGLSHCSPPSRKI